MPRFTDFGHRRQPRDHPRTDAAAGLVKVNVVAERFFRFDLRYVLVPQPLPSLWQREANWGRGGAASDI